MQFAKQFLDIVDAHKTKLICGQYKYPVTITKREDRLWFNFPYNKNLAADVKGMSGAKWHGFEDVPIKQWSVTDNVRNRFRICQMEGRNPYAWYDRPLLDATTKRPTYKHQLDLFRHGLTYHYDIWASETGTGKTLAAIELIEATQIHHCFYVAPKSALNATRLEFEKWGCKIKPTFITYDELRSIIENWPSGTKPPRLVIFDEASRVKNPSAKRSLASQHLADAVREEYGWDGYVILMSGSPAPKSPIDWWNLAEIAMPGFLKEGTMEKLRGRLAVMSQGTNNETQQMFAKLVCWKDDTKKCSSCGKPELDHTIEHPYQPSVNEIELLYKRLHGLVEVKLKKDALDLPDKIYKIIQCKPNSNIINAAKLLMARGESTIHTLTLLRELSDGFQYQNTDIGVETCPLCQGSKIVEDFQYCGPDDQYEKTIEDQFQGREIPPDYFRKAERPCTYCEGTGETVKYVREAVQIPCPKEDALAEIIDQHDDVGRLICYAGFTGSVDRCVSAFKKQQWEVIRVDGRGWSSSVPGKPQDMLKAFMYDLVKYPRLAFVAQPSSAGMGLNLTASPTVVYYSNDFNAESRIQSEDRIHRIGMDKNRGATIIDLFHLPTDAKVLDNLRQKKRLQAITLGEFKAALDTAEVVDR